jgi:hypothetical protein
MHFWLRVGFFRIQERLVASLSAVVAYRFLRNPADSLMAYRCCFLVSADGLSV